MPDDPQLLRERARKCRRLERVAVSEAMRKELQKLARQLDETAERFDRHD